MWQLRWYLYLSSDGTLKSYMKLDVSNVSPATGVVGSACVHRNTLVSHGGKSSKTRCPLPPGMSTNIDFTSGQARHVANEWAQRSRKVFKSYTKRRLLVVQSIQEGELKCVYTAMQLRHSTRGFFNTSNFKSTYDLSLASVVAILINGRLSFCVFISDIYYWCWLVLKQRWVLRYTSLNCHVWCALNCASLMRSLSLRYQLFFFFSLETAGHKQAFSWPKTENR